MDLVAETIIKRNSAQVNILTLSADIHRFPVFDPEWIKKHDVWGQLMQQQR